MDTPASSPTESLVSTSIENGWSSVVVLEVVVGVVVVLVQGSEGNTNCLAQFSIVFQSGSQGPDLSSLDRFLDEKSWPVAPGILFSLPTDRPPPLVRIVPTPLSDLSS